MSPSTFPIAVPILEDERVRLRELIEQDIPAWFARATDREAADLAGDRVPESIEMGFAWLQRQRELFDKGAAIRWAVSPRHVAGSIGSISLTLVPHEERSAVLGIVLGRAYWGQGLGTAAARLAVEYGFSFLGLAEVRAETLQRNQASIGLLERVGLKFVRELPPTADEPEAMSLYALSRSGWSAVSSCAASDA